MRPSRGLPPVELWRGVKPRKAANSRPLAMSPMSWIRGHDRRGGDRADAGNGHQPLGGLVGLDRHCDLVVDRSDRRVERVDLRDERPERGWLRAVPWWWPLSACDTPLVFIPTERSRGFGRDLRRRDVRVRHGPPCDLVA